MAVKKYHRSLKVLINISESPICAVACKTVDFARFDDLSELADIDCEKTV